MPLLCWQQCGWACWQELLIWTAEWYSLCCSNNFSSLLSPTVRRGFSQFVTAKVSPIWSAVYVLGYPSSQKPLCWIQSHILESHSLVPTTICIPVNLQQGACEECVLHLKLSEMDKRAVILIFLLSLSHLLASLLHVQCLFIYLFFFSVMCDWNIGVMVKVKFATCKVRSAFSVNY